MSKEKEPIERPDSKPPPLVVAEPPKNKGGRPRKDGLPPGSPEAKAAEAKAPAAPKTPGKIEDVYAHVQLTPEILGKAFGGLGLAASALDEPIWRLDKDEMMELGELWYPIAKVYEKELRPYIGAMMLLPGTIAIMAPRVKIRIAMRDPANGITSGNCRDVLKGFKGLAKDLVEGREVPTDEKGRPVLNIVPPVAPCSVCGEPLAGGACPKADKHTINAPSK